MSAPTTETAAIRRLIRALADVGAFAYTLYDGEEEHDVQGKGERELLAMLRTTDSDVLTFRRTTPAGADSVTVFLVYGNDPEEVISDWSIACPDLDTVVGDLVDSWF